MWWMLLLGVADAGSVHKRLPHVAGQLDRWDGERSFGTRLTVHTLLAATERLAWEHPFYDPVTIGDISVRGGGPMYGHTTHDEGIDADLGLFVENGVQRGEFVHVPSHDFDPEANWNLLKSLLDTGNVQFVLLDQRHIHSIRAYLVTKGMSQDRLDRMFVPRNTRLADDLRGVVRHAPNHSSHMHVRITPPPPKPRFD